MLCIPAILNQLAIHIECLPSRLHRVACNSDNALDEIAFPIVRRNEDEHIPARRLVEIEHLDVRPRNLYPIDKLAYQNPVADEQRVLH